MADSEDTLQGRLYAEGMQHNWRTAESLAQAALSRANFEQAAQLGHLKAMREFAEMLFAGAGGPKDMERALWLKWSAHLRGDREALEELSALLGTYSEDVLELDTQAEAKIAAEKCEEAFEHLRWIESFLQSRLKTPRLEGAGSELSQETPLK